MTTVQDYLDAVVAQLVAATPDRPAPVRIEKGAPFLVGGNTEELLPAYVDKHGRIWREERTALVLVFDPTWHS
jgi:hypothetical protein